MTTKICKICGKEYPAIYPNTKYCSILCKEMAHKKQMQAWNEKNQEYMTIYMRKYRQKNKQKAI